jgi:hypothetical protein
MAELMSSAVGQTSKDLYKHYMPACRPVAATLVFC